MKVYYLDHSGFAVETENYILVFDYFTKTPVGGGLEQGVVTPELLPKDKRLAVFASHCHHDHYNKVIHQWAKEREGTLLFLGDDIYKSPYAISVSPGGPITAEGITLYALPSTDQGVAFLVQVDGHTIYHAGDLNWWHWEGENPELLAQMDAAYCGQVDKLIGAKIDIAFLPVDPRLENTAFWGAQYFMEKVGASRMFPMHMWGDYDCCKRFMAHPRTAPFADKVAIIDHRGQCFQL